MIKEEKRTNPNIEKLMKRISINKNAEYETINHEEAKYLKVKKEKGRVGSQIKKYNDSCEK